MLGYHKRATERTTMPRAAVSWKKPAPASHPPLSIADSAPPARTPCSLPRRTCVRVPIIVTFQGYLHRVRRRDDPQHGHPDYGASMYVPSRGYDDGNPYKPARVKGACAACRQTLDGAEPVWRNGARSGGMGTPPNARYTAGAGGEAWPPPTTGGGGCTASIQLGERWGDASMGKECAWFALRAR